MIGSKLGMFMITEEPNGEVPRMRLHWLSTLDLTAYMKMFADDMPWERDGCGAVVQSGLLARSGHCTRRI
jgi:hypothetical protein